MKLRGSLLLDCLEILPENKVKGGFICITVFVFLCIHPSRHCQENIFGTTKPFVTKFGIMVHHHEPECHGEKICLLFSRSKSHSQ